MDANAGICNDTKNKPHGALKPACPKVECCLHGQKKYIVNGNKYFFIIFTFIVLVEVLCFFLGILYILLVFFGVSHRKRIQ